MAHSGKFLAPRSKTPLFSAAMTVPNGGRLPGKASLGDQISPRCVRRAIARMALPIVSEVGALEPWQPRVIVLSRFSAEPAFSVAVLFGIFVCTAFVFGSHQGIRTAVTRYSVLMIRNFDRSMWTFTMSGQSPMRLLMRTVW